MGLATGLFNINNGNPPELNTRSFAGQILRRYPNGSAPMFALSSQSGKSIAKQSQHGYFTKVMSFQTITTGAAALVGAASMTWPSTVGVVKNMVFHNNRTGENIRVTAVTNATDVAVDRAFGRIAAAAVNVADVWVQVGTAHEEGSNRPSARRLTMSYVANYTQIFRNAWALTGTAKASLAEAGYSNIAESRSECAMFHSVDIESAMIWGQPKMDTTGSTPVHSTQGVLDAIAQYASANVVAAGGTTTYDQLVTLVEPIFLYAANVGNPKERVGFCDAQAMRVLNQIGRKSGQVQIMTSETSFGMRFTKFEFYKGSINLIEHPLLNGLGYAGTMIVMDMAAVKLAYLNGRDTAAEEYNLGGDTGDMGIDASGGSLTSELAVELINPFSCGYVTGLTAGA